MLIYGNESYKEILKTIADFRNCQHRMHWEQGRYDSNKHNQNFLRVIKFQACLKRKCLRLCDFVNRILWYIGNQNVQWIHIRGVKKRGHYG